MRHLVFQGVTVRSSPARTGSPSSSPFNISPSRTAWECVAALGLESWMGKIYSYLEAIPETGPFVHAVGPHNNHRI